MWQPAAYERESSRARSVIQAGAGNFFVCLLSRSVTASSKAGAVGVDEGRLQRRNLDSLTQRHRSEGASILRTEKTKKKKRLYREQRVRFVGTPVFGIREATAALSSAPENKHKNDPFLAIPKRKKKEKQTVATCYFATALSRRQNVPRVSIFLRPRTNKEARLSPSCHSSKDEGARLCLFVFLPPLFLLDWLSFSFRFAFAVFVSDENWVGAKTTKHRHDTVTTRVESARFYSSPCRA